MSNNAAEVLIDPLFADILSGEFILTNDPERRAHTLGRLAYASLIKGELIQDGEEFAYVYSPSWASTVDVRPRGRVIDIDRSGNGLVMDTLSLGSRSGESLVLGVSPGAGKLHIGTPDHDAELELELGPTLAVVKHRVTLEAQNFFDQVVAF